MIYEQNIFLRFSVFPSTHAALRGVSDRDAVTTGTHREIDGVEMGR